MNNIKNITQDGDKLVLKSGTTITPSTGTVATHIADVVLSSGATASGNASAINNILLALEGIGALADS